MKYINVTIIHRNNNLLPRSCDLTSRKCLIDKEMSNTIKLKLQVVYKLLSHELSYCHNSTCMFHGGLIQLYTMELPTYIKVLYECVCMTLCCYLYLSH